METELSLEAVTAWLRNIFVDRGPTYDALVAVSILIAGFVVAMIGQRIARKVAGRAARLLTRYSRREVVAADTQGFENAVGRTVYWLIVVFAVMAATETARMPVVTTWLGKVASFLPRLAVAIVVVAVGSIAARVARHLVTSAATSATLPAPARLGRLAQLAVLVSTWLVAVEQLGIEISFLKIALLIVLAALLGGAALAFGMGGGQLVANILSAHYLQKVYQVGQTVRVDSVEGRISRITETAVILESAQGQVIVPAKQLAETRSTLLTRGRHTS